MGLGFYFVVCDVFLALTPVERWQAARRFGSSFMGERWFMLTAVVAMIILVAFLIVVSLRRAAQEKKAMQHAFLEYADRRGLSKQERQTLVRVAREAGLHQSSAIFSMEDAFDRAATRMVETSLSEGGVDESKRLRSQLSFVREKLGFQKQRPLSIGSSFRLRRLSSREITIGRKVELTRRKRSRDSGDIEATVVGSDDVGLAVHPAMPIKIVAGESWRVRCHFGASIWEFDTSMISYDGSVLVLNHSDDVRFINRRRFLRVPVCKQALVAQFPFAQTFSRNRTGDGEVSEAGAAITDTSGGSWGPPKFIPAIITELAGPGLRIDVPMHVKTGDRVLVVFKMDEGKDRDATSESGSRAAATSRVVEDIGEVRHTRTTQNGLSIAVELTGLSDSDVSELIRATNSASLRANSENLNIQGPVDAQVKVAAPGSA
ncbi:MAG: PilZ domain-containing protein [Planctomycetota bacterium]|jgi:hypothetical protein